MLHEFDPGYGREPYRSLVADYPGVEAYPRDSFRVEWGPVFHRGRLDGSARVLVIGQDPAQHEQITRRILVGEAGRRTQGLLFKLGVTRSYVLVNTFLYGVHSQRSASLHKRDPAIVAYRHRWLGAILESQPIEAVIALGDLASDAWNQWKTSGGKAPPAAKLWHPTRPESSSRGKGKQALAAATEQMLANWNAGLEAIQPAFQHPDQERRLVLYGKAFARGDRVAIPECDLPAGTPGWMIANDGWAERGLPRAPAAPLAGRELERQKRSTIVVTVPAAEIPDPE